MINLYARSRIRKPMKKLLLLFLLAACVYPDEINVQEPISSIGDSSDYGNFLAAEYASLNFQPKTAVKYLKQVVKKDSDNPTIIRDAYNMYAVDGDIKNAAFYAEKILKNHPEYFIPAYICITESIQNRKFDHALNIIGKLNNNSFNLFIKPFVTAWLHVGKGDFAAAYKTLEPLAKEQVFLAIYNFNTALIADMEKDYAKAKKHYIAALNNTSGLTLTAVKLLGKRIGELGEEKLSADILEKYREINFLVNNSVELSYDDTPPISIEYAVAEIYTSLASVIPASDVYNRDFATVFYNMAIYLYPDFSLSKIFLADTLSSSDKEEANRIYASIKENDEFYLAAQLKIARNYAESGDTEKAEKTFGMLAERFPTIVEPYSEMGDYYRMASQYEKAEKEYTKALQRVKKTDKVYWALLYSRGICLERMKRWKEAEADLKEAMELNPNNAYILNYLGYCWLDRGINLEKAFQMIKQAYDMTKNDGHITDSLAWAFYMSGNYDYALQFMEKALTLQPGNSVINDHLGDIYWELKRYNEARYQWKKALELDTDLEEKDRENIKKKMKYGKAKNVPKLKIKLIEEKQAVKKPALKNKKTVKPQSTGKKKKK